MRKGLRQSHLQQRAAGLGEEQIWLQDLMTVTLLARKTREISLECNVSEPGPRTWHASRSKRAKSGNTASMYVNQTETIGSGRTVNKSGRVLEYVRN